MADPGLGLRFQVTIDGQDLGNWQKCDGLGVEYEIKDYNEGGQNGFVHRLPGRAKYQTVKLVRPVDATSIEVAGWLASVQLRLKDVPDDGTVVLIAGPTSDILPTETDALNRYLAKGGKLMVMLDPPVGANAAPLPNLEGILKEWGITAGRNVVVDITGATNDPSIAVAQTYPLHAITERFSTLTIYPLARSIDPIEGGANGRVPQKIVETTRGSWAEANLASLSGDAGVSMDEASGDKPGPVSLGVAVSAPVEGAPGSSTASSTPTTSEALKPETRVVVFGDSDFPSNAYGGIPGNLNLFANAISWLAQQENLIAIRPVEASDRRITLTPRAITAVALASRFGIPAAVFVAGIVVWRRRRR